MRVSVANSNLIITLLSAKSSVKIFVQPEWQPQAQLGDGLLNLVAPSPIRLRRIKAATHERFCAARLIPSLLVRKYISVFNAGAWLSHHIGHGVTPFLIMRCFLVLSGVIRCTISLNQHKTRGVILLLDDIKSGDAWLLYAAASIFKGGGPKSFHLFRLNMGENMHY